MPEREGDEHNNLTELSVMNQANGQWNTSAVCICGKLCKNLKGLKIHQARMASLRRDLVKQCSGMAAGSTGPVAPATEPSETEEEPRPESQIPLGRNPEVACCQQQGAAKAGRGCRQMPRISKDSVDRKLLTMYTITINTGADRFGVEEKQGASKPAKLNRREAMISQLRQELKFLKRQFKMAKEDK